MKINSSSLHQIIHDAPNKTVFTNKISHKPILIVLPKRDYISIVQDERMNHGNWDYIYKALRVVCDAKPLLNLTNHEKIRKVDTKCTFLFRNYYFFANWVPANPVKAMNYETFGNGYTTCGYGGLCVISKSICNLLLKIFEAKEVFPYLVPSWRLIFVPQTVCGWQITLGRIDPRCVFNSLKAKHWACWVSASCS